MRLLTIFFLLFLLFGCLSTPKSSIILPNDTVTAEEEPPAPVEPVVENNTSLSQEEKSLPSGVMLYFFDVHSTAPLAIPEERKREFDIVSGRVKDGRLLVLKQGPEEMVIWSVPNESYEKALNDLHSVVDFPIEYFVVPSYYSTSVETVERALEDLDVVEVVVPDYLPAYRSPVDGKRVKAGDVLEVGNTPVYVLSPIPERLPGDLGNSITLQVDAPYKALLLLDANPALLTVLYSTYGKELKGWVVELPLYGRGTPANPTALNLMREYGAEVFVVEGAPLAEQKSDPYEDRAILRFIQDILKRDVYATWLSPVIIDLTNGTVEGEKLERE